MNESPKNVNVTCKNSDTIPARFQCREIHGLPVVRGEIVCLKFFNLKFLFRVIFVHCTTRSHNFLCLKYSGKLIKGKYWVILMKQELVYTRERTQTSGFENRIWILVCHFLWPRTSSSASLSSFSYLLNRYITLVSAGCLKIEQIV